ncbi:MAG: metalloregulator ArsR/SmtB family transcription factor [Betaproteobacteria bacterium]
MDRLDDRALEQVAEFFRAFSVPLRLKILNALREGERNVGELTEELASSQANISKHLAVLAQSGLIARTLRGTSAYYQIIDPRIYQLCDIVCGQIGQRLSRQSDMYAMFTRTAPAARRAPRKAQRR